MEFECLNQHILYNIIINLESTMDFISLLFVSKKMNKLIINIDDPFWKDIYFRFFDGDFIKSSSSWKSKVIKERNFINNNNVISSIIERGNLSLLKQNIHLLKSLGHNFIFNIIKNNNQKITRFIFYELVVSHKSIESILIDKNVVNKSIIMSILNNNIDVFNILIKHPNVKLFNNYSIPDHNIKASSIVDICLTLRKYEFIDSILNNLNSRQFYNSKWKEVLKWACIHNNLNIVKNLIKTRNDLDIYSYNASHPFYLACVYNNHDIMYYLADMGLNFNIHLF